MAMARFFQYKPTNMSDEKGAPQPPEFLCLVEPFAAGVRLLATTITRDSRGAAKNRLEARSGFY